MKEGIHPDYYQATVNCNCGNTFVTGSTSKEIHVEICSKCHPFYTGQQKATQARGRVDKFNKKYGIQQAGIVKSQPILCIRRIKKDITEYEIFEYWWSGCHRRRDDEE